jgi:dTDP-4-dehydrorhamnose 3,5-epimerase-like enzyme
LGVPKRSCPMIDGVKIKRLKVIPDERGRLMEILRSDDEERLGTKPGIPRERTF